MRSYFIIVIGIIVITFINQRVYADDLNDNRKELLSWFDKDNISVRASVFGGRTRHSDGSFEDEDEGFPADDRFRFDGRTSWGGEFGIGYKIKYGIELGISYMFQEINDYHGLMTLVDPGYPNWHNTMNMDIDSRAVMFNTRVYVDELAGWNMGRFSPYILASAGRATHKVTDFIARGSPAHNNHPGNGFYNLFTSHKNKGVFAYRLGMGTLFKVTDHISMDASASFMDWGKARSSRYYQGEDWDNHGTIIKPVEPDVRTIQGSVGIQINF